MEKRTGWGTEYSAELRNGEWEYQAFTADKKVDGKRKLSERFECHKLLEKQDYGREAIGTRTLASVTNRS